MKREHSLIVLDMFHRGNVRGGLERREALRLINESKQIQSQSQSQTLVEAFSFHDTVAFPTTR